MSGVPKSQPSVWVDHANTILSVPEPKPLSITHRLVRGKQVNQGYAGEPGRLAFRMTGRTPGYLQFASPVSAFLGFHT